MSVFSASLLKLHPDKLLFTNSSAEKWRTEDTAKYQCLDVKHPLCCSISIFSAKEAPSDRTGSHDQASERKENVPNNPQ